MTSIFEGQHIDLGFEGRHRYSKVDTSFFESRRIDLRRSKAETSHLQFVVEYCPQLTALLSPWSRRSLIHTLVRACIKINNTDSISNDERGFPLTQYITNGRISRGGYTFTHFKHNHRVLRLISYSMSI